MPDKSPGDPGDHTVQNELSRWILEVLSEYSAGLFNVNSVLSIKPE